MKCSFVEFIIPTYNRINELRCILSSLICQKDDDWCANVVVDDIENDKIVKLINGFDTDKIKYTFLDKRYNDFGHTPREIGKNLSNSNYIVLTGDDNYYTPNFVGELKIATVNNPVLVYWDMVHNHNHYETKKPYCFWKTLLVNCGVDMGSFATRRDVLQKEKLDSNNFCADGLLVESILKKNTSNYEDYLNVINEMIKSNDFSLRTPSLENVYYINKVLFVHN